jgi:hypothetical protein
LISGDFQWPDVANLGDSGEFFVAAGDEINVFGDVGCRVSDVQIKLGRVFIEQA